METKCICPRLPSHQYTISVASSGDDYDARYRIYNTSPYVEFCGHLLRFEMALHSTKLLFCVINGSCPLPMTVREVNFLNNKLVRLVNTASTSVPGNVIDIEPAIVLPYLIFLNVSNNKLSRLPTSMEVPSLQTRSFGDKQFEDFLADVILQCSKSLSSLEGPNNQLRTVPSLFDCTRLITVALGDNALREVPAISPSVI